MDVALLGKIRAGHAPTSHKSILSQQLAVTTHIMNNRFERRSLFNKGIVFNKCFEYH